MQYDVFNGDADGICALHQLRLAEPSPSAHLVTGVKRDITLLSRLTEVKDCSITVCDISLESNRPFLDKLLQNGNRISYFDHHYAGPIPEHKNLHTYINPSADLCTSLIVNTLLQGRFSKWGICGAFGDNLQGPAQAIASSLALSREELTKLREIGELLNYNSYGATLQALHFHPIALYRTLQEFDDPLDFFSTSETLRILREGFNEDIAQALAIKEMHTSGRNRVYLFPAASWSQRISGVFSNMKAAERSDLAHMVIMPNTDSTFRVSVRAPLTFRQNADTLCRHFPTGGGRAAAAGINNLPNDMFNDLIEAFNKQYP
jgi:hypothetical protein